MSKLEELIKELCPNGVEFTYLKNICKISKGVQFNKSDMNKAGSYPVINGGINPSGYIEQFNQNENTITVSQGGASAGYVNWISTKFWAGAHCYTIEIIDNVSNRYLFHFLKSKEYKLQEFQYGAGIPALSKSTLENLKIPLPPLPVQEEIVRILDDYTEQKDKLIEELKAELTARKQQYEYYRDYLLDFSDEEPKEIPQVEWKKLGDIATDIYRGVGIKRDEITETGTPCVRYGEIYTTYNVLFDKCVSHTNEEKISNKKYFEHGDVLFAITGESVEDIAKSCVYLGHEKCLAGGDVVVLKHNQNPKYMGYVLSTTNAQMQKSKGKIKSKVVHSSVPAIKEIVIPLPPLEEQERIANQLEKFDSLCNDINDGLPSEIESRRKQYEYYRDKLLTFDNSCSQFVKVERESYHAVNR